MAGIDLVLSLIGASFLIVCVGFWWITRDTRDSSHPKEDSDLRLDQEAAVAEAVRLLQAAQDHSPGRARSDKDDIRG